MDNKPESAAPSGRDADTEQRILQAARKVFVSRGTAGARMQEIAAEAGVNQALLHYYFRSKDRLASAVFREAAARLLPAVVRVLGSDEALETKVERFVHLYIDTVRHSPFLPAYVISELHHHPERIATLQDSPQGSEPARLIRSLLRELGKELEAQAAAGKIRPITPEQFVANLMGLVVIPFVARPVLTAAFDMDEAAFDRFLDDRRESLSAFILNALRP